MNNNDERDYAEEAAVQAEYERECEAELAAELVAEELLTPPVQPHVDYPHTPGTLYDCPACEQGCYCENRPGELCVGCALNTDVAAIIYREDNGHTVTSYVPPF